MSGDGCGQGAEEGNAPGRHLTDGVGMAIITMMVVTLWNLKNSGLFSTGFHQKQEQSR